MRKYGITTCLLFIVLMHGVVAQTCPANIDFEDGDFTNWQCSIGITFDSTGVNITRLLPSAPIPYRHKIISAATPVTLDPYGGFPTLYPYGGAYSVKLGNDSGGAQSEGLAYTFTVPNNLDTFSITYYYAVVFEDPTHAPEMQPRFIVKAYDVASGNEVSCASYDFIANNVIPGFNVSPVQRNVMYKPWTPASLQLSGLRGRQVRLEFRTADCTAGQHFGYAYIDVGSSCSKLLATAPYCAGANSIVLNAPSGFQSYTWYNSDFSMQLGNTQFVTLSPPPVNPGDFFVDLVPYPGFGCRDTARAVVTPMNVPGTPAIQSQYTLCQYQVAAPLSATPSPGNILLWYTSASGDSSSFYTPTPSTLQPGEFVYYVSEKVDGGCESARRKITVTVKPIAITRVEVNQLRQCLQSNNYIFTATGRYNQGARFLWDFGDGDTLTTFNDSIVHHVYTSAGNFAVTLRISSPATCPYEIATVVTVVPTPVASFNYPSIICGNQTPVVLTNTSTMPGGVSSINKWWWNVDGVISTMEVHPPFVATNSGMVSIALVVTTVEGCLSDTNRTSISVYRKPSAAFALANERCSDVPIAFQDFSAIPPGATGEVITKWNWTFGTMATSILQHPVLLLPAGSHAIQLIVETNFGCISNALDTVIHIEAKPALSVRASDSCISKNIHFNATDMQHSATKWYWNFGNGYAPASGNISKTFFTEGNHSFMVIGESPSGCRDTLHRAFTIYSNKALAGADTIAAINEPVQLQANGGSTTRYTWSPSIGLSNTSIENPVATLSTDQQYHLYAVTKEGCESYSGVLVKRYKGPALYIPTAFTPNDNGKNDVLRVIPVGIRHFKHFSVYNRYGQRIFYTTNYQAGWNGLQNGQQAVQGTYIAVAEAVDYNNQPIINKTTVVLIR